MHTNLDVNVISSVCGFIAPMLVANIVVLNIGKGGVIIILWDYVASPSNLPFMTNMS